MTLNAPPLPGSVSELQALSADAIYGQQYKQYIRAVCSAAQYNYRRSLPETSSDSSISSIFKLCAVRHSITTGAHCRSHLGTAA